MEADTPETPSPRHVALGFGRWVVNHGTYRGLPALFFEPAPAPGPVNQDASKSGLKPQELAPGSVVITFENADSYKAMQAEMFDLCSLER